MIHVLVVHDTPLICNAIASILDDEPDIEVVGRAASVEEALAQAAQLDPNVILLNTTLPDNGALKLVRAMSKAEPPVKVLTLGLTESKDSILRYIEAGASGYVLQDNSVSDLVAHIRAAYDNQAFASPPIIAALMSRVTELAQTVEESGIKASALAKLTPRETEVLELIGEGLTNQGIAHRLVIEVGTVKNHVHNILDKLGVNSRKGAAAYLKITS